MATRALRVTSSGGEYTAVLAAGVHLKAIQLAGSSSYANVTMKGTNGNTYLHKANLMEGVWYPFDEDVRADIEFTVTFGSGSDLSILVDVTAINETKNNERGGCT